MKKTRRRTQNARFSFSSEFFVRIFIAKSLRFFTSKVAAFRLLAWTCQHIFLSWQIFCPEFWTVGVLQQSSESVCEGWKGKQLSHLSSNSHKCTQDMAIKPHMCYAPENLLSLAADHMKSGFIHVMNQIKESCLPEGMNRQYGNCALKTKKESKKSLASEWTLTGAWSIYIAMLPST